MTGHLVKNLRAVGAWGLVAAALSTVPYAARDAQAVPIDSNISITASVDLNGASSAAPTGLTQSATFTLVQGGVLTSSTVAADLVVSGTVPLLGALTDIGDGVGIAFAGSGDSQRGTGSADLFGDYAITLTNNSATDTFKITLGFELTNRVDANGSDAAIEGEIVLLDGATEIFFSNLISDTLLGDSAGGSNDGTQWDTPFGPLGSFGAALLDDGIVLLDFSLAPNQTLTLTGEHNMFADLFNGDYSATIEGRLFVSGVTNESGPAPIPAPASLLLLGAGLFALRAARPFRIPSRNRA